MSSIMDSSGYVPTGEAWKGEGRGRRRREWPPGNQVADQAQASKETQSPGTYLGLLSSSLGLWKNYSELRIGPRK